MKEEQFSPQDSIRLIQSMLEKSKQDISGNDVYFLLWGWTTFAACTGQFVLKNIFHYPKHYLVWWIMVIAAIVSVFISFNQSRTRTVKTYVGESMSILWTGMGISFFALSMILTKLGWGTTIFPFFIMMYGLGTFVSGGLLRFRPFMIGGLTASAIAIVSAYLSYDYQMLMAALAILVSYLIPTYMLRRKTKYQHQTL